MLTKSEMVLEHAYETNDGVQFVNEYIEFLLPMDRYEDMGRPQTITVTIEPGDRLND